MRLLYNEKGPKVRFWTFCEGVEAPLSWFINEILLQKFFCQAETREQIVNLAPHSLLCSYQFVVQHLNLQDETWIIREKWFRHVKITPYPGISIKTNSKQVASKQPSLIGEERLDEFKMHVYVTYNKSMSSLFGVYHESRRFFELIQPVLWLEIYNGQP